MEWRQQSSVSCDEAYLEAQRWIEAVTEKKFGSSDFRSELENGVRLCDLINKIKPGIIKRVNRLPTPIAGLDNLNVFLKACGKLGLKEAQLFHPGDLQDLSSRVTVKDEENHRRLKNVLITIYWLGRRAQKERSYDGPYLNFKAFEGLLGTALSKALQDSSSQKSVSVRDSGFGDSWYLEREEPNHLKRGSGGGGGGGGGHRRDDSLDSLDSVGSRPHSISSDNTLKGSSEGCYSDSEADSVFKMAENRDSASYRRSLVLTPKTTSQFNQFLPSKDKAAGYVPAPLRKKQAERNKDNRRSFTSSTYTDDDAPLVRQQSMPESADGSKSTSDIHVESAAARQIRYEELQKFREQVKESEDKWQDDLSKWKNRRRSVNSDIVKKKEEREKIEQITTSGGGSRRSKTFKEMQEERENKGGRLSSLSYSIDDDVFEKSFTSAPRSRTLPPRSYTDASYFSSEPSVAPLSDPPSATPAIGSAASPPTTRKVEEVDSSPSSNLVRTPQSTPAITSNSHSSLDASHSQPVAPSQRSPVLRRTEEEPAKVVSSFISRQKEVEPRRPLSQVEPPASSSSAFYKQQPPLSSMEPNPPAVSRVSASLPRNYQRLDSARLTSVVTPRPFGSQASRITSLTRANPMEDSHKRVNGDADISKRSSVPSRYHQFMTPEEKAQSSSSQGSDDEEEEEEEKTVTTRSVTSTQIITSTQSVFPAPSQIRSDAPLSPAAAKETSQEKSCEMRISLNQKPGSSRDFGFQAAWDSTGARVKSIQPGSPAQMCQMQVGDEVVSVNGHQVADMSYTEWKAHMEEALDIGSLIMDIRRHGQNNWDRDQASLPFKSHKVINLTSTDHPILLGSSDGNVVSPSLDFTSRIPADFQLSRETPARPLIDVASNGVHGGFREESVTMRNKESEPISLKNLKRRSEFFETGGSESAMPDIPVPSITPSSSRWSWDPEEERKRQEKWQKEQERLLQEKYKRDQEKLQEEWLKAQEDIAMIPDHQELGSLEVNSHSLSPHSLISPLNQPTSLQWEVEEERKREEEEEERRRKEEQERQRQAEERRKREEEERELQRLQEERKRREQQEEEERKRREEEELRWQKRREEEQVERRRQEYAEQQRRERERALEQQRTKSKSSPQLDEMDKPQAKGAAVQAGGLAHWLLEEQARSTLDRQAQSDRAASELELERRNILNAMRYREPERVTASRSSDRKGPLPQSQAELERQQILMEMKKKTPLLTDSSWIRQRSSSSITSQDSDAPPMRRGESLDNLDSSYNAWRSSWTPRSNSYVQNYARPHSALSGSSSFYSGGPGVPRPGSSTLPSSYSMGSLRGGAGNPSSTWSRQSLSPSPSSPSPTASPEPTSEAGGLQQRSRSVSGKKICTFCDNPLGKGAAMIIESLGLCYHLTCFKCFDCKSDLGGSEAGAEVRIRSKQLYCNNCYMRFKSGQPTAM